MHQITAFLLTLLFLVFTGCEDKKPDQKTIPVENTATVVVEEKQGVEAPEVKQDETPTALKAETSQKSSDDSFMLLDMQQKRYTASLTEEGIKFHNTTKPIVLLQFFSTWCAPCIGEIAYLNDLHEAYQEELFVAGVLTRDTIENAALSTFINEHHINYTILQKENNNDLATYIGQELGIEGTIPVPLIVLYANGRYYTHYEGSVPVEMVKYDIKQIKKQLQKN